MRHICCGALNAYIVCGDNPDATVIAARIGRREPWAFLPFGQVPADALVAIDETRFIALTAPRNEQPQWMAVFDAEHRKQAGPTIEVKEMSPNGKVLVTRDRHRLVYLHPSGCICWSIADLTEVWRSDFPDMTLEDASERDDGCIIVKASRLAPPEAAASLVLTLSAEGRELDVHELPAGPLQLSAGGRWLHRPHEGSVLVTDSRGGPIANLADLADAPDEQLVEVTKTVWIHGLHEIWSAAPPQLHARLVVRSMPLYEALPEKPSDEAVHTRRRLQTAQQSLLDLEREGAEQEEIVKVRAEVARLRKLQNDLVRARGMLRWLARFSEIAPYEAWQPGDPPFFERLPPSEVRWARQQFSQPFEAARGAIETWEAGDQAFFVSFPDKQRRRVAMTGELGEMEVVADPGRNGVPPEVKGPALRFLRAVSVPTMRLGRLDEYNCVRAIEDIITRLRTGVHKVVWGDRLTLRFALPEEELTEKQFFEFVAGNCDGAAVSVRHLLAAYDQAAKSKIVWSDEGVGALGYAALALAHLDPEAYTALEGYFSRRNPREEWFGTKQVLPAIAARTHSFGDMGALRFALRRLPEEELEANAGALLAPRIIQGARVCCSPAAFVREVERAARAVMWRAEIEKTALAGRASWSDVRTRMAAASALAQLGMLTPLLRAADPLEDWDFAFIALARRRRINYPLSASRWLAAWRSTRRGTAAESAAGPPAAETPRQRDKQHRIRKSMRARPGGAATPVRTSQNARDEEKVAR